MRIRISHPSHLLELSKALAAGHCLSLPVGTDALEVVDVGADDAAQAERALVFFLKAWQMAHPFVRAELIP